MSKCPRNLDVKYRASTEFFSSSKEPATKVHLLLNNFFIKLSSKLSSNRITNKFETLTLLQSNLRCYNTMLNQTDMQTKCDAKPNLLTYISLVQRIFNSSAISLSLDMCLSNALMS